jgi:dTDP-4-dehydrorhamnose 3,5-epimerase
VDIQPLRIAGAWRVIPTVFGDARGSFSEWFRTDLIEQATGFPFVPVQANISHSARGVLRGIHFAQVPPGQAKFVMPVAGSIIDFVVDIRVGSPTFGEWDSVTLDSANHDAVMLEPGLGHAFLAMDDRTTVNYLVTDFYRPEREHGIDPFDPEVGLEFPAGVELHLSDKDSAAPSLAEARDALLLPVWEAR